MIRFKIAGIRFTLDFSFLIFTALIFLIKDSASAKAFFLVCLIHETGHALALCMSGIALCEIIFCGMGIKMLPKRDRLLSLKQELFVLFAGPLANLAAFALIFPTKGLCLFAMLNLSAAIFNLMPYRLLDGGSAVLALASSLSREREAQYALTVIQALLLGLSLWSVLCFGAEYLPFLCAAIFYFRK